MMPNTIGGAPLMTTGDAQIPEAGSYAEVNGLTMYYEIHGTGQPLVLLHGALSAIGTSFGKVLPSLAETRRVIALELQAHGRTADVDRHYRGVIRPEEFETLARSTRVELRAYLPGDKPFVQELHRLWE